VIYIYNLIKNVYKYRLYLHFEFLHKIVITNINTKTKTITETNKYNYLYILYFNIFKLVIKVQCETIKKIYNKII